MDNQKLDRIIKEYNSSKENCKKCGLKIKELLKDLLNSQSIEFHEINYRIKNEKSLRKKYILKNEKYNKLEDITDIIGIRIITYYSDDIDRVAQLIEENFDVDEDNSVDKREVLEIDKFGYLSLHYVVKLKKERLKLPEYRKCQKYKVEIQIRSILQHAWAEIEHDLGYKNDIETPKEIRRNFYRLAGLLETADKEFVDIRNQISDYEKNIKARIKDKEEIIFIDRISLESYISNDTEYNRLVSKISKNLNIKFSQELNSLSLDLKFLLYMHYETINQIKEDIVKNKEKIYNIAREILQDSIETLPKSAILMYLCYTKLAEKDDINKFIAFFYANDILFDEDEEDKVAMEFAKKIIKAYRI